MGELNLTTLVASGLASGAIGLLFVLIRWSAGRNVASADEMQREIRADVKGIASELRAVHDEQIRQVATLEGLRERVSRVEAAAQAAHRRLDEGVKP